MRFYQKSQKLESTVKKNVKMDSTQSTFVENEGTCVESYDEWTSSQNWEDSAIFEKEEEALRAYERRWGFSGLGEERRGWFEGLWKKMKLLRNERKKGKTFKKLYKL